MKEVVEVCILQKYLDQIRELLKTIEETCIECEMIQKDNENTLLEELAMMEEEVNYWKEKYYEEVP